VTTAAIIPARNEERTIREVADAARAGVDLVIVVDDGSTDRTVDCLSGLDVIVLSHESARGKAAALASGFERAVAENADRVVTLDGDGQHDPADIPRLLDAARAHPDHIVIGARVRQRHRQPKTRRFANRFADFWVSWASGQPVADSQTGFRVYPCALLDAVRPSTRKRHGFVYETAMLVDGARAGFPCIAVAIDSVYRDDARPSYFRPGRDIWEIFWFIFWRILLRALYLPGLWRALRRSARFHEADDP